MVCEPSPDCCGVPSPPFYTQGQTFLNAQTGFLLECPPGFSCDAGLYPYPIIVPKGRIPFTPPTNGAPLRFTCCDGVILTRFLPIGYTQAQFNATAQAIVDDAATHLAGCMATQYNQQHATRPSNCSITTAATLPDGDIGTPYSQTLAQTGATGTATWSLVSGALPPGLSLSSAGVISGMPTGSPASYGFVVRARGGTISCTKLFTLTINGCDLDAADWCTNPGTCRLRIKNFNAGDWTFAWDGNLPNKGTNFAFPCGGGYEDDTGFVGLTSDAGHTFWTLSILCLDFTNYIAQLNGASPIGTYTLLGPPTACGGPASFDIEGYTP